MLPDLPDQEPIRQQSETHLKALDDLVAKKLILPERGIDPHRMPVYGIRKTVYWSPYFK